MKKILIIKYSEGKLLVKYTGSKTLDIVPVTELLNSITDRKVEVINLDRLQSYLKHIQEVALFRQRLEN